MPRVNRVARAAKPRTCGGCRGTIEKGSPYSWAKPRYGGKMIRCGKCRWRASDLSNAKTARIEDAIEDARESIDNAEDVEGVEAAMQEVADAAREVADEYQEAMDSWGGGSGTPPSEWEEKQSVCSDFADECDGWSPNGDSPDDARTEAEEDVEREDGEDDATFEKRKTDAGDTAAEEALEEAREEALGVLDGFSA